MSLLGLFSNHLVADTTALIIPGLGKAGIYRVVVGIRLSLLLAVGEGRWRRRPGRGHRRTEPR